MQNNGMRRRQLQQRVQPLKHLGVHHVVHFAAMAVLHNARAAAFEFEQLSLRIA
jgi:hypothetical protein